MPGDLAADERLSFPLGSACRTGQCGSDPVLILSGGANLSPPDAVETATLKRLGLLGTARMACCARVQGDVEFSLDPPAQAVSESGVAAPG